MKKSSVWVLETLGGGKPQMRLLGELTPEQVLLVDEAVTEMAGTGKENMGGRLVVATSIDRERFERYLREGGRSGRKAHDVHPMQVFDSAAEASLHIGCRHNEVCMGLSRAKALGEDEATVRGITFRWADDTGRI